MTTTICRHKTTNLTYCNQDCEQVEATTWKDGHTTCIDCMEARLPTLDKTITNYRRELDALLSARSVVSINLEALKGGYIR